MAGRSGRYGKQGGCARRFVMLCKVKQGNWKSGNRIMSVGESGEKGGKALKIQGTHSCGKLCGKCG
jgi:hypothetical protein